MAGKAKALRFVDFGAIATKGAHVFSLTVGTAVVLSENAESEHILRAKVSLCKWGLIADTAQDVFNRRLREHELHDGSWKKKTLLDRLLGRELCLLMWQAAQTDAGNMRMICQRWAALRCEKRWLLYVEAASQSHTDRTRA